MLLKLGRHFSLFVGLLLSSELAFAQFDWSRFRTGLGLPFAAQELVLNPCVPESVMWANFGQNGVRLLQEARSQWPAKLCENVPVALRLFEWQYTSSALLAQTERPVLMQRLIETRKNSLAACDSVACLSNRLPRMIEWAKINLDRTAVYGENDRLPVRAEMLSHPRLSLRGLVLPLQEQLKWCGSSDFESLEFYTVNIKVSGQALVMAQCKTNNPVRPTWLIENASNSRYWIPILLENTLSNLYIMPNSRYTYPTLYSRSNEAEGVRIRIAEYGDDFYRQKLSFLVNSDASGMELAFDVHTD